MRGRPAGGAKPGADPSAGRLQVPAHWTPAQAAAVFEMLDELRDSVWRSYGGQIQQALREDRAGATSATAANLGDGDVPF